MVLGGHGDSMVPLASSASVSGIPVTQLIPKDRLDEIVARTRKAGGEIVALLKTGSAYYAPGAAVVQMIECLLKGSQRVLPVSVYLEGEYGVEGVFIGVPVVLGSNGVEKILEIKMAAEEKELFQKSAGIYKENLKHLPL
jgi:malate dehydrogenase